MCFANFQKHILPPPTEDANEVQAWKRGPPSISSLKYRRFAQFFINGRSQTALAWIRLLGVKEVHSELLLDLHRYWSPKKRITFDRFPFNILPENSTLWLAGETLLRSFSLLIGHRPSSEYGGQDSSYSSRIVTT